MAGHGLAHMEDAIEVGAHQGLPVLRIKLIERRAPLHAGVVDQDVDGAQARLDIGHRRVHRLRIGHIKDLLLDR